MCYLVSWVNSYAFGTGSATENCSISMIYAPGHSFFDQQPASVPALVTRYANEILHNLYCTRLFVWEQVSGLALRKHVTTIRLP